MDLFQATVLGIVQGVTEYLPVSSSAHLVLVPWAMDWSIPKDQAFVFDVLVQLGTLVGVFTYFAHDLYEVARETSIGIMKRQPFHNSYSILGWLIVLATIPAAFIGMLFKDEVSAFFSSPKAAMGFLLVTAGLLIVAELLAHRARKNVKTSDAVAMGIAQSLALLPGISRSGSTIAAGMLSGLSRESAARFSFLMSVPIMLGASLVAFKELFGSPGLTSMAGPLLVGFIAAAISGYLVIRWFMAFLKHQSLLWFAAYCGVVGVVGLAVI